VRADAIACPDSTQCTAVDSQGQEVTFDPQQAEPAAARAIDWGNSLEDIACPSSAQCTAVDNHGGQFTFDPAEPGAVTTWRASAVSLFGLACVSITECVGVGNPQNTAVTFDPVGAPSSSTLPIEEIDGLGAVSCPAASQCTATTLGDEITFDPAMPNGAALVPIGAEGWIQAIACPTVTQCTAVEFDGQQITFDPSEATDAKVQPIGISTPWGVACPSTEQCTAVGESETSTFDPLDPERPPLLGGAGGGFASAIACPEVTQCTVVANDEETTFDPQTALEPGHAQIPPAPHPPEIAPMPSPTVTAPAPKPGQASSRIVVLSGAALTVSRDRANVAVRCLGEASCSIELALGDSARAGAAARASGRSELIGSARRTIAAHGQATVAIVLTRAGVRLLQAHGGHMTAQLAVNGRGGSALIHASRSLRLTSSPRRR